MADQDISITVKHGRFNLPPLYSSPAVKSWHGDNSVLTLEFFYFAGNRGLSALMNKCSNGTLANLSLHSGGSWAQSLHEVLCLGWQIAATDTDQNVIVIDIRVNDTQKKRLERLINA